MTTWGTETNREKLERLRSSLENCRAEVAKAEAELKEKLAEVTAIEQSIEASTGHLQKRLTRLEAEIESRRRLLQRSRIQSVFGSGYPSIEEQYQRTWATPPDVVNNSPAVASKQTEKRQLKRLYRQLARRYHPDLAANQIDLDYRNEKMVALNDAYAAGSVEELLALHQEPKERGLVQGANSQTELQMIAVLERELERVEQKLQRLRNEVDNLHNHPLVLLTLEMKLARLSLQDLLDEMAAELEHQIKLKRAELISLGSQFNGRSSSTRIQ